MSSHNLRAPQKRLSGKGLRGRDSVNYRISEDCTDEAESRARRRVTFEKQKQKLMVVGNMDQDTTIPDQGKDPSLPEQEGSDSGSTYESRLQSNRSLMETMHFISAPQELSRLQAHVPDLETTVRTLEHENHELRRSFDHHHRRTNSYSEDAMRRLRNKNTKLMNENDTLLARVHNVEREVRDGVGGRVKALMEEVNAWRQRCDKLSNVADELQNDVAKAADRNRRLEEAIERSRARNERGAIRGVDRYKDMLRQHGLQ